MRGLTSRVDPIPNCINVPFPAQSECELRPVSPYGVGHFRKNSFIDLDESRVADLQPTPDDYTAESLFRGGGSMFASMVPSERTSPLSICLTSSMSPLRGIMMAEWAAESVK